MLSPSDGVIRGKEQRLPGMRTIRQRQPHRRVEFAHLHSSMQRDCSALTSETIRVSEREGQASERASSLSRPSGIQTWRGLSGADGWLGSERMAGSLFSPAASGQRGGSHDCRGDRGKEQEEGQSTHLHGTLLSDCRSSPSLTATPPAAAAFASRLSLLSPPSHPLILIRHEPTVRRTAGQTWRHAGHHGSARCRSRDQSVQRCVTTLRPTAALPRGISAAGSALLLLECSAAMDTAVGEHPVR